MITKYKNIVAIDLGTKNMRVCLYNPEGRQKYSVIENEFGKSSTPSYVSFDESGDIIVGDIARNNAYRDPENVIYDTRRLIGRKYGDKSIQRLFCTAPFKIVYKHHNPFIRINGHPEGREERDYSPEEILAYELLKVKDMVKVRTDSYPDACVITVPAYFSEPQRAAIKLAAHIAGLNCIKLISEPIAASLYCMEQSHFHEGKFFVFDFGAGSFDVTILQNTENQCKVLACLGNNEIGSEDIDAILCKEMINRFMKKNPGCDPTTNPRCLAILRHECECAKISLSSCKITTINVPDFFEGRDFEESITRAFFISIFEDEIIQKICFAIDDVFELADLDPDDIDHCIILGDSSRTSWVHEILDNFFDKRIYDICIPSDDEAVAKGAAIFCDKMRINETGCDRGMDFVEYLPISIGFKQRRNQFQKSISSGKPYPQKAHYDFLCTRLWEENANIWVYQGEDPVIDNNEEKTHIKIGKFTIRDIPRDATDVPFGVDIEVDKDGILNISAKVSGREENLPIDRRNVLSHQEIQEAMNRLKTKEENCQLKHKYCNLVDQFHRLLCRLKKKLSKDDFDKYEKVYNDIDENFPTKVNIIIERISMIERLIQELGSLQ